MRFQILLALVAAAANAAPVVVRPAATATRWSPKLRKPADTPASHLYLRGEKGDDAVSRVLLRFRLPRTEKKLARARLRVFVPEVRNLRMICETACREITGSWDKATLQLDETTDYGLGRPDGIIDSHAFWEMSGQYFPHRYGFLACPEGGRWVEFNVTMPTRKWIADPSTNHGLALHFVHLGDRRFPNRAAIDIPSQTHPDATLRPQLVLEFADDVPPYRVAVTHTLRKYCDRSTRYRYTGPYSERYELAMARNEFEGFQVLVYPMVEALDGVTLEWTDLVGAKGRRIPKADVQAVGQEVFPQLHRNGKIGDWYFHGKNFAMPDPLVPLSPSSLPPHMHAAYWVNVRTRPDTPAGLYRGTVTVRPSNAPARTVELTVRVWDYTIPETWNFETMGQTCWGYIRRSYGRRMTKDLKRKYIDFLLDHRFSPTEQYADKLSPDAEDIPYCIKRGMSTIYLSGNFTGNVAALKERYDKVRAMGLIDKALVYIGDETKDWNEMRRRSDAIRRACPELMIMIGGSFPRKELDGIIDIFDPQIDRKTNRVYSLPADEMHPLIAATQAKGEKFFWYVAAGPMLPCPNVQMEDPLIASRVLFWLTWKFGVTGFEYYCYNIWSHNIPKDGKRWPEVAFYPRGWGDTNGDGMLFYPGPDGPISSVRFENIRDGIEDWESHYVLRDCIEATNSMGDLSVEGENVLKRAKAILAVPDAVTKLDFTSWTWEPQVLLQARRDLGETIEAMKEFVSEQDILDVRADRKRTELARQRAMLKARAAAAR